MNLANDHACFASRGFAQPVLIYLVMVKFHSKSMLK
jgi:hypothetical protein